jgi:hypothetical protein
MANGLFSVTVVGDNAAGAEVPRLATLAPADVLSFGDAAPDERGEADAGHVRIVLAETLIDRTPWVFRTDEADASPQHRVLVVAESRREVDLICGWARWREKTFTIADVNKWDNWLASGRQLEGDTVGPSKAAFRRRRLG